METLSPRTVLNLDTIQLSTDFYFLIPPLNHISQTNCSSQIVKLKMKCRKKPYSLFLQVSHWWHLLRFAACKAEVYN